MYCSCSSCLLTMPLWYLQDFIIGLSYRQYTIIINNASLSLEVVVQLTIGESFTTVLTSTPNFEKDFEVF